jgi:hypothetical protein
MTEQEERVKEVLDDLANEVAEIAGEQDNAMKELSGQLSSVEETCETLRKVLGDVEIVTELEGYVSDARSAADELNDLVQRLADLKAPAAVDDAFNAADDAGGDDE